MWQFGAFRFLYCFEQILQSNMLVRSVGFEGSLSFLFCFGSVPLWIVNNEWVDGLSGDITAVEIVVDSAGLLVWNGGRVSLLDIVIWLESFPL